MESGGLRNQRQEEVRAPYSADSETVSNAISITSHATIYARRRRRGRSKKGESVPLDKVVSFVGNTSGCGATVGLETCQYIVDASSSEGGIGKDALADLVKSLSTAQLEEGGFLDYVLLREVAGDVDDILDSMGASKTVCKNFQKFIKTIEEAQDWAKKREARTVEEAKNKSLEQENQASEAPLDGSGKARSGTFERERGVLSDVQALS